MNVQLQYVELSDPQFQGFAGPAENIGPTMNLRLQCSHLFDLQSGMAAGIVGQTISPICRSGWKCRSDNESVAAMQLFV